MALTIGTATNARSKVGLARLKADFNADLLKITSRISGSKYDTLVKTVKNNWSGADADDFLSDLKKTSESLKKQVKALKNEIEKALDDDYNSFIKFQQGNIK